MGCLRWAFVVLVVLAALRRTRAQDKVTFYRADWRGPIANPILVTLQGSSRLQCKTQCIHDPACFAISSQRRSSDCQILGLQTDLASIPTADKLENTSNYIIYIKRIPCSDSLCENGGKCQVYQPDERYPSVTFSCTCPKGFCGRRCESGSVEEYPGKAILFFNIDYQRVASRNECVALCSRSPRCKSVVFQADFLPRRGGGCWLKEVDHTDVRLIPGVHVIPDPKATYVALQNAGQCRPESSPLATWAPGELSHAARDDDDPS